MLPTETAPYSPLNAVLYRAHVYMITHGAVLCGETPQYAARTSRMHAGHGPDSP